MLYLFLECRDAAFPGPQSLVSISLGETGLVVLMTRCPSWGSGYCGCPVLA